MPIAMRYTKPEVQERIARDFVMGSLSLAAQRRCEALRRELPELDKRIYRWSEHLQPLSDAIPELTPSPKVWAQIDASIKPASSQSELQDQAESRQLSWWDRLPFVRALAVTSSFLLVALLAFQVTQVAPPRIDYLAVLADEAGDAVFVATASERTKVLQFRRFANVDTDDADLQLWALSKTDGEARSLGILGAGELAHYPLSEAEWRLVTDAKELLVTVELPGGSAIGEPSDEVVSRGLCIQLRTG